VSEKENELSLHIKNLNNQEFGFGEKNLRRPSRSCSNKEDHKDLLGKSQKRGARRPASRLTGEIFLNQTGGFIGRSKIRNLKEGLPPADEVCGTGGGNGGSKVNAIGTRRHGHSQRKSPGAECKTRSKTCKRKAQKAIKK